MSAGRADCHRDIHLIIYDERHAVGRKGADQSSSAGRELPLLPVRSPELDNAGPSLGSSDRGGHHAVRASAEYGVEHQVKRQIRERHQTASSRKFSGCRV